MEQIENDEIKSHIFRSKARWTEEGERSSKIFFSLEKRNYINKLISSLEINGKILNNPNEILEAQTNVYQKLYSEKINETDSSYDENLNAFLINNNMLILSSEERESCDKLISQSEILKSIKELSNGSTPRSDGLPTDWYKFF